MIKIATSGDANAIVNLIKNSAEESIRLDFNAKGWERFIANNHAKVWEKKLYSSDYWVIAYHSCRELLGVLSLYQGEKLEHFFVAKTAQNQGIGRTLWQTLQQHSGRTPLWLRASGAAVPIYQHWGWQCDGPPSEFAGIHYQLMRYQPEYT